MAPPIKTIKQYEQEAAWVGECLVHPGWKIAVKLYRLRHCKKITRIGGRVRGDYPHGNNKTGLCVLHTCDNPRCILDAHHFLGTKQQNTQDAVRKGRHSGFRKGGTRFSGPHTKEARQKIAAASRRAWREGKH